MRRLTMVMFASVLVLEAKAAEILFRDNFRNGLGEGWSWRRENKAGWRVADGALQIRVEPGNMWGGANDAKNVLVRSVPEPTSAPLEISVTVSNRPTEQYEQVDLVWYYDDSHQVKVGQEQVDGKLSIVMGREEKDRTRTIAIIPLESLRVQLRFLVQGDRIRGQFRPDATGDWREAGACSLPVQGEPKIALQCYQGPRDIEHWAHITDFVIRRN